MGLLSLYSAKALLAKAKPRSSGPVSDLLQAMINGGPFDSGAGAPTSTPVAIGSRYYDTTNKVFYVATDTTSAGWVISGAASSGRLVAAGSTLTLTQAAHDGKIILLDTATGSVVTLPAASGSGMKFEVLIKTKATSNSHIVKVANSSDIMQGILQGVSDDPATCKGWIAGAADDTITLNRGTTGSVSVGERIDIRDIAANVWAVQGWIAQTGTEATPWSSTV